MKSPLFKLLLFIFSTSIYLNISLAQNTSLDYADWLFNQGLYDYALQEYLKDIYNSSQDVDTNKFWIYNKIAECYLLAGEYEKGINWCENTINKFPTDDIYELNVTYSILLMRLGFFEKSEKILLDLDVKNCNINSRRYFLLGCSEVYQWKLDGAIIAWQNISIDHSLSPIAAEYITYTREAQKIKFLNPIYGAVLGIVPGLGYLYAGHKKTAISALTVIGLTFWGTAASFENNLDGIGYLTGFLTLGWYSGSIYGSFWACNRNNNYNKNIYLSKIKY